MPYFFHWPTNMYKIKRYTIQSQVTTTTDKDADKIKAITSDTKVVSKPKHSKPEPEPLKFGSKLIQKVVLHD